MNKQELKEFNESLDKIMNEKKIKTLNESKLEELQVGDIVYLRGDYGLYDTQHEILKITDSHDEEIKNAEYGSYLFKPDEDVQPLALLKSLKDGKMRAYPINPEYGYKADPIELVSSVDSLGINSLDLESMAASLETALHNEGIDTDIKITMKPAKGKAFPKLEIEGTTNLVDQAGIWKYAVKELTINSWDYGYVSIKEKCIRFSLYFSYKHTDHGSNGCEIGYAKYNLITETWEIELGDWRSKKFSK